MTALSDLVYECDVFEAGTYAGDEICSQPTSGGWKDYRYLNWREHRRPEDDQPPRIARRVEKLGVLPPLVLLPEVPPLRLGGVKADAVDPGYEVLPTAADAVAAEIKRRQLEIITADDEWLLMN